MLCSKVLRFSLVVTFIVEQNTLRYMSVYCPSNRKSQTAFTVPTGICGTCSPSVAVSLARSTEMVVLANVTSSVLSGEL